jgi:hypothetical protein
MNRKTKRIMNRLKSREILSPILSAFTGGDDNNECLPSTLLATDQNLYPRRRDCRGFE